MAPSARWQGSSAPMAGAAVTGDGLLEFRREHLTDHKVHDLIRTGDAGSLTPSGAPARRWPIEVVASEPNAS